jgi:hypothetical protein
MHSRPRVTVERLDGGGRRVTARLGDTLEETKDAIAQKMGFSPAGSCRCKLYNKHGAEIDSLDLIYDNDLLYAGFLEEGNGTALDILQRTGEVSIQMSEANQRKVPCS